MKSFKSGANRATSRLSGVRVERIEDFDAALAEAVAARRFTLIDALIDPAEYWEQM